jgi:hypothetical protein
VAYFPNGSAGSVFDEQCGRCRYGDGPCPIWRVQHDHNYSACNNKEARKILDALVSNSGDCSMFKLDETWFGSDQPVPEEALRAYLELQQMPKCPPTIRELILKAAGRIA